MLVAMLRSAKGRSGIYKCNCLFIMLILTCCFFSLQFSFFLISFYKLLQIDLIFCHFIESSLFQGKGRAFCAGGDAAVGSQAVLDGNYSFSLPLRYPIA